MSSNNHNLNDAIEAGLARAEKELRWRKIKRIGGSTGILLLAFLFIYLFRGTTGASLVPNTTPTPNKPELSTSTPSKKVTITSTKTVIPTATRTMVPTPTIKIALPDPIAFYKYDGNATDSMGMSNNFQLQNTEFIDNTLFLDGVYHYDGGYIAVTELRQLDYEKFTISLDFYPSRFNRESGLDTILMGGTSYRWFGLRWNNNHLELTLNNQDFIHTFQSSKLEARKWHNVICSVDIRNKKITTILDGQLLEEISLTNNFSLEIMGSDAESRDKEFTFANYSNAHTFVGYVDNFRVFDDALSTNGIEQLYQRIKTDIPMTVP